MQLIIYKALEHMKEMDCFMQVLLVTNTLISQRMNKVSKEKEQSAVPEVGSVITGKVIRVAPHQATIAIMVVGETPCKEDFMGVIRTQDVRAAEKDKVKIYNSFRPGDIVKADVISLGDARSYVLSTAKNELGVIFATSVAGVPMIPISWQEMQCPKTKTIELRKCAKPV
ncbi:hypothetical protein G6F68_012816 [Rhizopus microsporus]|nr:hypothetical protein G6F68_012816 [Rhizopus microsporus]